MVNPVEIANDRFADGFNCCQAIFSAFAQQLALSDDLALRLAAPFGAGFARQGQVCGALTGALMVLGLKHGNVSPDGKEQTYRIAEGFVRQFHFRHGAILCRELIGYDVSRPEELQAARAAHAFTAVCPALVQRTAQVLAEFLEE